MRARWYVVVAILAATAGTLVYLSATTQICAEADVGVGDTGCTWDYGGWRPALFAVYVTAILGLAGTFAARTVARSRRLY